MKKKLKVLNLEDNPNDTELIRAKLDEEGIEHEMTRVETREGFIAAIEKGPLDIILADNKLPYFDGMAALEIIKEKGIDVPFIFVTGSMGEELAVETLKRGASDYVLKNSLFRLPVVVRRALAESEDKMMKKKAEEKLKEQLDELQRWVKATVGRETRMKELKDENEMLKARIEELEG